MALLYNRRCYFWIMFMGGRHLHSCLKLI